MGKRNDGFHDLESLLAFTDLADELEVEKSNQFQIKISGKFAEFVDPKNNLLTKTLDFFATEFGITKNLYIRLKKNIPVGGGLGGGSSDAAQFMKILNKIFALNLNKNELQKISLNFGSDIAFFFEDHASIIKGRGEVIENFPSFEPIPALLVNPCVNLSTKEIFYKFGTSFSPEIPTQKLLQENVFELIKSLPNDLEKAAISTSPIISEILDTLKKSGADHAKMSGSGTTCFGIFANEKKLDEAKKTLQQKFPRFFIKKISILSHV
ncbi:MAG: 4-(cytidine 5'-diphospho)-2-C-methyl-D-erythritol kinase [Alphaproteobacteria bacterium RIFCSPLOWO2_01_FULL_40_26]|nr:MAG: 4-(cytidine 5'-diphospho)-2-C-methyl-D-erythritol kinase [Alphaproteobacteria bacterium RIFCSPHIGHO2_02_FULL_40_34]OFW88299.1 MAG: 4-(cytidine 5'-diphospho)-2-C-methyl-D-erythritol kinase [Alphaproteobacteria bacterium RIFCSPHIGHO2_01_FULL_40_8]OFW94261.1 MAG: 4-(cytidine 5'-diphospho)-2-C-methyl-D-erythritol kinase [Alphaproteobacteria bacterium RIFCSPLOWO2_01_FULL_40_26]